MQLLLETRSLSWAESVRIALLAEGIDAVILDEASAGTLGLYGSIRLAISDDADMTRALEVVSALQPPRTPALRSWWWHKRAIIVFVVGLVLARFAGSASDMASTRVVRAVLIAATVGCFVGAVVLMVLGYRADQKAES